MNIPGCDIMQFGWFLLSDATASSGPGSLHYRGFTITLRYITVGRTPLDEWSARRRDLYLTTYNTYKRQTSMPPAVFEPAIPASERPQTHALDRAATVVWHIQPFLRNLLSPASGLSLTDVSSRFLKKTFVPIYQTRRHHNPNDNIKANI
jgi:hypothetical protein